MSHCPHCGMRLQALRKLVVDPKAKKARKNKIKELTTRLGEHLSRGVDKGGWQGIENTNSGEIGDIVDRIATVLPDLLSKR